MTEPSLFDNLGGAQGIARLVDAFYDAMDHMPEFLALRSLHAPDLQATRDVLKLYLAEWTGGPANYSAAKGHPRMRQRHMHIPIGEAERDDWMRCMTLAMEATLTNDEARARLTVNFTKLADWMRNKPGNAHDAGLAYGGAALAAGESGHVANSTVEKPTNCPCSAVRD
jgi:hemoglobin